MDILNYIESNTIVFLMLTGFLGLFIGSFLNVVIYRLPIMLDNECKNEQTKFNLVFPRSHCIKCGKTIEWWCNIPLISFLFLLGKCSNCKNKISLRYPLIELLTAAISVFVASYFGFNLQTLAILIFSWILIALVFIDIEHQILPDELTLTLLWVGLLFSALGFFITPSDAIIGSISGYVSLWTVARLFTFVRKIEGMGYGDFKLFAALGAWLGWQMLIFVLLAASLAGAIFGIIAMSKTKDYKKPIPFGPFLAVFGWLSLFYGNDILNWYLNFLL